MNDRDKTKKQLLAELAQLRKRLDAFQEGVEAPIATHDYMVPGDPRWHSLVANAPIFVLILDRDHRIRFINHTEPGDSPEAVLSKTPYDYCLPEYHESARRHIEEVFRTGKPASYQAEAVIAGHESVWYQAYLGPIFDQDQVVAVTLIAENITARKQVETALQESEERYRLMAESIPHPVWRCDAEGRLVEFNRRWCEYTGQTPEEARGNGWVKALHPDDAPRVVERVKKDLAAGSVSQTEFRLRRASDGSYRWHFSQALPMKGPDGRILWWFGSTTDIHEQKAIQEELERRVSERTAELTAAKERHRQSEENYRGLLEASPDAVVMCDTSGRVLFASRQTWPLLGVPDGEEITGHSMYEYTAPQDRERLAKNTFNLAEEGERKNTQYMALRRDGTTLPVEVSSAVIRNARGQIQSLMAVIRDITQRKRAEEALRQSLGQLQTIYDGVIEGVMITDIESKRFVRVNSSMCRMLGYSKEELLKASVQDIHPPGAVPEDLQRFMAAAEGRVEFNEDRPVLRKDGTIFYADISGHRIEYDGRPCLLALFRDVTERREAQESLRRERRTLLHLLRASDHERQLIAYDIHDGLTQQLAAAMMQFETYDHLRKHQPEGARTAYEAGVQMLRQAHFEARRLISGVRPPILDESGIVAAIAHLVHEQALSAEPKIEFQSDVQAERLPAILANAVYRVAQEALANACQHSGSPKIRVSLVQDGPMLRLEVRDWGTGFSLESVPENRFGLEGIKQRTRLLGGELSIETEPGKGTSIRVALPILEDE